LEVDCDWIEQDRDYESVVDDVASVSALHFCRRRFVSNANSFCNLLLPRGEAQAGAEWEDFVKQFPVLISGVL
jgi:hypothetical protein